MPAALDRQARLIRELERAGRLDRALEFLPDDETLAARAAARRGLTRPELAVLLAYAKMSLDQDLLASDLPDAPELAGDLRDYFPPALRDALRGADRRPPAAARDHRDRRRPTISSTAPASPSSTICRRAPAAAPPTSRAATGSSARCSSCRALWAEIEALDNRVAGRAAERDAARHRRARRARRRLAVARQPARSRRARSPRFAPAVAAASPRSLADLLPPASGQSRRRAPRRLAAAGVPQPLAARVAGVVFLTTALEVGDLAERAGRPIDRAARTFYGIGARFALDEMRAAARRLPAETPWQKTAVEALIDDFYGLQAELAARVLQERADGAADPLAAWAASRMPPLAPAEALAAELRAAANPDLAMLVVAGRQLRQALG